MRAWMDESPRPYRHTPPALWTVCPGRQLSRAPFAFRSCSKLEAEGTEFYTRTERFIATKESPRSANQPGHRISPSCVGLRLVPRLRTRCDAHHKKALCSRKRAGRVRFCRERKEFFGRAPRAAARVASMSDSEPASVVATLVSAFTPPQSPLARVDGLCRCECAR